jgi:hypothetical protein
MLTLRMLQFPRLDAFDRESCVIQLFLEKPMIFRQFDFFLLLEIAALIPAKHSVV